ncbi:MAG TPA: ABC transporter permease subunit [Thermoanaerobaculia bacterium]|nr:ABC transporter permease subunit [Thermoanaerobaculia bacterium]
MARKAVVLLIVFLCGLPLAVLAVLSFAGSWPFPDVLPSRWTASRWLDVLAGRGGLAASFGISIFVSTCVALLSTALGFVTSKHVAYHHRRRALLFLAYVPFALSPVILGVCLLYVAIEAGLSGTVAGVILAQTIFAYGFAIVLFHGLWSPRMRAFEDLVRTLGGSTWQVYRRVLVPLAKEMLLLCFFQTFLISWFQYGLTVLVGGGQVKTLTLKVYDYVGEANVFYAALASCLLIVPPAVLLWLNKRFLFKAV